MFLSSDNGNKTARGFRQSACTTYHTPFGIQTATMDLHNTNHRIEVNPTMSTLKNLPTEKAQPLDHLIDIREHQVVSMSLSNSDHVRMTMLAFDAGEGISAHAAGGDAMVQILEGEAEITIDGVPNIVKEGESIIMPKGISHALKAVTRFKMLLTVAF